MFNQLSLFFALVFTLFSHQSFAITEGMVHCGLINGYSGTCYTADSCASWGPNSQTGDQCTPICKVSASMYGKPGCPTVCHTDTICGPPHGSTHIQKCMSDGTSVLSEVLSGSIMDTCNGHASDPGFDQWPPACPASCVSSCNSTTQVTAGFHLTCDYICGTINGADTNTCSKDVTTLGSTCGPGCTLGGSVNCSPPHFDSCTLVPNAATSTTTSTPPLPVAPCVVATPAPVADCTALASNSYQNKTGVYHYVAGTSLLVTGTCPAPSTVSGISTVPNSYTQSPINNGCECSCNEASFMSGGLPAGASWGVASGRSGSQSYLVTSGCSGDFDDGQMCSWHTNFSCRPVAANVCGTTAPTSNISFTFTPNTYNFGNVTVANSSNTPQNIVIKNTGTKSASGCDLLLTNPTDFILTGTCASFTAGSSCSVSLNARPTAATTSSTKITLICSGVVSHQKADLNHLFASVVQKTKQSLIFRSSQFYSSIVPNAEACHLYNPGDTGYNPNDQFCGTPTSTTSSLACCCSEYGPGSAFPQFATRHDCLCDRYPNNIHVTGTCGSTSTPVNTNIGLEVIDSSVVANSGSYTVTGVNAGLTVGTTFIFTPNAYVFPNLNIGLTSEVQNVNIKNNGTKNVSGCVVSITNPNDFILLGVCPSINAGLSCDLSLKAKPSVNIKKSTNVKIECSSIALSI